ncbi:DpnI domain-containing protein [Oricola nitratireducens]|uniref:DpnI domain-containing protein n=1 Tax=Oricola nitratireducens TaxID=2775868 RepID=UPI0018684B88|nr:DpnI domain-containing protein [Oricola nitratireducens]
MKLGFEETQTPYVSGSQRARVWTEGWVSKSLYCPNCGNQHITQFAANRPVADFFCPACGDEHELKSQKKAFGAKVADGAYHVKCDRLLSSNNPNLLLLNYDLQTTSVTNVCVIPKHFFALDIVEKRKPLAPTARRAGWIGSNILLNRVPESGRIYIVRDGITISKQSVLDQWNRTLFLRETQPEARGWLLEVMKCVESLGYREFDLDDVYAYEDTLSALYPNNKHVKPKIRQQLQLLRDNGYLKFLSRGRYRIRS